MCARFLGILTILLVILSFSSHPSGAENIGPIKDSVDAPQYVQAPSLDGVAIEASDKLSLGFTLDFAACKAHYGEDKYYAGCVRNRHLAGLKAAAGVTLTPPLAGDWRWDSDSTLSFSPKETWRAGETYKVALDFDALGVPLPVVMDGSLRQYTVSFQTKPLALTVSEMTYLQDPENPARKLVAARLEANYPVVRADLERLTHAELEETRGGKLATAATYKPEFTPDAQSMGARVAIPLDSLPDEDRYLRLTVDAGVTPLRGGAASPLPGHERVRVPSLSTYLKVSGAETASTRLPDSTPEQVLSFQTNIKAAPEEVAKGVKLYLLPAQHPVTKLGTVEAQKQASEKLYKWKAASEVTPEILKMSTLVPLVPVPSPGQTATSFSFSYVAPSGHYLYFVADKDLTAFGGYTLGRPFETILSAPEWPHDLEILQEGSILTLSGAHKLSLRSRGADELKVDVAHIRTEALQHFVSQTSGDLRNPSFNYNFGVEDIAKMATRKLPVIFKSPELAQYASFDFSPYLEDGKKGVFLVSIQGYREGKPAGSVVNRFVLVSDLGLLVKDNAYKGRDVFLMSFASGKSVAGADVSVVGRNGLSIFRGKTGPDGHASLPDFTNFSRDRSPVAVTAQKAGDYAFIPYNRDDREVNTSRFDVGGAVGSEQGLKAVLFSDRGIYRPGDTVHLGALLHSPNWTLPAGLPLRLVITDPRDRKIRDEVLKFSSPGIQEFTLATGEGWATGQYQANLSVVAGDDTWKRHRMNLLGSTSFRVEEFQPDTLRLKTVFAAKDGTPLMAEGWTTSRDLAASITLTNLYGTPASARRVTAAVTLNPGSLSFAGYSDYSFYDAYPAKDHPDEATLPDAKTDDKGQVLIPLGLDRKPAATYRVTAQVRGFEAGSGRGVTAYTSILVSPMTYAVGSRSRDNLSYLRQDSGASVELVAVDPHLARTAATGLMLELFRKSTVSTLVRHDDGSYAYEASDREELVESRAFLLPKKGATLDLPTHTPGDLLYRVKADAGRVVMEIPFTVAGDGEGGDSRGEADLRVSIDKPSYETGEKLGLSISAPYTGAGLITLESDHVLAYKWFRADRTDTLQSIAIPKDFSGKGYVSVAFVRSVNSHEIYRNPASYAIAPFVANLKASTTAVTLDMPARVKPGEAVTVHYHGNARGKILLYAVDEGILQVARYHTPDPLRHFLLDRALQVRTLQMLDLLMPEYALVRKLSATGGDGSGDEASTGKHLNPFKRRTLAPAVFWSGLVDLDTEDKTVVFTPPGHFNGEMRVMAVAATAGTVGNAEKKLTVQGDLILTPNTPVFLAPGDEAHVSVTVANNLHGSGKTAKVTLSAATTDGLLATGLPQEPVTVPEGQEISVDFTLKARDNPGPASLTLTASLGTASQSAEATLSVRPPVAKETTLLTGYSDTGSAKIELKRKIYASFASRDLTVAPLPTAYVFGLLTYLDEYPYGCSEQTISKAFPQLSLAAEPELALSHAALEEKISVAVETLRRRQTSDGGFSYWDGESEASLFITAYGLEFLTRAREAGFPVPPDMVESALRYLRDAVNRDIRSADDARDRAYSIYVMTSNGVVTTSEILHLLKYYEDEKTEWKTDLSAVYIAASYQLMQQGDMANQLLDDFAKGTKAADMNYQSWDSMTYNPFIKHARYLSLLARHFPDRVKTLDPDIVFTIAAFIREERYSTLSSVYAIQALMDYQKAMGKALADAPPKVTADGHDVALATTGPLQRAPLPPDAQALDINGPKARLFYTVAETGFDKTVPDKPLVQNMQIERVYQTLQGKPVGKEVALGEVIEAVVTVNAIGGRHFDNVAVVDLLPAGFELVLDQPAERGSLSVRSIDRREDRIIAFATVSPEDETFHYRLRAVAKGSFTVPAPYAEAMYDLTTKARGHAGTITIQEAH